MYVRSCVHSFGYVQNRQSPHYVVTVTDTQLLQSPSAFCHQHLHYMFPLYLNEALKKSPFPHMSTPESCTPICHLSLHVAHSCTSHILTYIMAVAKLHPLQDLPHHPFHIALVSSSRKLLQVIQNSVINKLKDKVQPLLLPEHFDEVDQIFVTKLLNGRREKRKKVCTLLFISRDALNWETRALIQADWVISDMVGPS